MKTYKLFLVAILVLLITSLMLGRHLFYYGKSSFDLYSPLPLKIKPENRIDNPGRFELLDGFGFSIAGKGVVYKFKNGNIIIEKILRYGFNSEKLIVVVEDNMRRKYNIEFSAHSGNSLNDEINVKINLFRQTSEVNLYKWIQLEGSESYSEKIKVLHNYIMFTTILLIIAVSILSVRQNRKKAGLRVA